MSKSTYNRLTDNDTHWGFVDIGARHKDWRPLATSLESGDDENNGCGIYLRALGWTVRIRLPAVIRPWREWVDLSRHEWAHSSGYWDIHRRAYGISLSDGFLQLFLGPQTGDSTTTKSKSWFLPWTQWRHVRHSLYGLDGQHHWTHKSNKWGQYQAALDAVPKVVFDLEDHDGERVRATTHIEEREWRFGDGWFKWLSLFRKPRIKRSLSIEFNSEVGGDKGSWKGGVMGTGIDMVPGELHEQAIRRYCAQEHRSKVGSYRIKFVGASISAEHEMTA